MLIAEIEQCIKENIESDLVKMNFLPLFCQGEDGSYQWHFRKENQNIRFMEFEGEYIKVTFTLYGLKRPLGKEIFTMIPESTISDMAYGYHFCCKEELEKLLIRLKNVILTDGIVWMNTNCEKYRREK